MIKFDRKILSWALYDWANSAFATTVMAGFFPLFFKKYWASGLSTIDSTYYLGIANTLASLVVAISAPLLGVIADRGQLLRPLLILTTWLGALSTMALYFIPAGGYSLAMAIYAAATIGFSAAMIFYDAALTQVAPTKKWHRVSALGYALGYLGGGLLFAINVGMVIKPQYFFLHDSTQAVLCSFLTVGIWWLVFSLPLFTVLKNQLTQPSRFTLPILFASIRQLGATCRDIHRLPQTFLFLLAYWFYIDGVGTVIKMAVDYGLALGLDSQHLMLALLITQFVGWPATLIYVRLLAGNSPKWGITVGLLAYIAITLIAAQMDQAWEFYLLAVMVGMVQGGVQALSRSYFAELIPVDRSNEFFGFYNMLGKFAVIFGPLLIGWSAWLTQSHRLSILSVNLFFVVGLVLLWLPSFRFRSQK